MPQNLNLDKESPDFSNYFKRAKNSTPKQYDPNSEKKQTVKKYGAMLFCAISVLIAIYFIQQYVQSAEPAGNYQAPAGYEMISPNNEPPRLEKIK